MSSNDPVPIKAIWPDYRNVNTLKMTLPGSENTVAMAVGTLGSRVAQHVSLRSLGLTLNDKPRHFPNVKVSDMLRDCPPSGLTVVFAPEPPTQQQLMNHLTHYVLATQSSVEPNTISMASSSSTANSPQVTMDSQLKEMLASMQKEMQASMQKQALMQKEMQEIRGKNEKEMQEFRAKHEKVIAVNDITAKEIKTVRIENESMRDEIGTMRKENKRILSQNERILNENERILNENESLHLDNERIDSELASVRKDLNAARIQHTEDVEALRILTLSLIPLHLRVLLDRARGKILEHLGHESWEGLRSTCTVSQLADDIFDKLKKKGVSHTPPHQAIDFLCSYNNIRRAGNTAAHTAKEEEVRHAVLTQPLESRDREYLENLFTFAYEGKQL
ncbi:hypothetical protein P692DRAFT_20956213 [Suillus brevipes Sb2]|nr:hypothetical protein P692DRAFT_20956213 [Suillus brevipes Sb2]